jgi:dTDP-glucose 4,6-dehydratase
MVKRHHGLLPYVLLNCSNNYGPFHFPEKIDSVVLLTTSSTTKKRCPYMSIIPVIGFFVEDHAVAIVWFFHEGSNTETNIGGFNEWKILI